MTAQEPIEQHTDVPKVFPSWLDENLGDRARLEHAIRRIAELEKQEPEDANDAP